MASSDEDKRKKKSKSDTGEVVTDVTGDVIESVIGLAGKAADGAGCVADIVCDVVGGAAEAVGNICDGF